MPARRAVFRFGHVYVSGDRAGGIAVAPGGGGGSSPGAGHGAGHGHGGEHSHGHGHGGTEVIPPGQLVAALVTFSAAAAVVPHAAGPPPIPQTPILDTFNRANESPLSDGGRWTLAGDAGANMAVVSAAATGSSAVTSIQANFWNPSTFGPNCECYVTVNTVPGGSNSIRLALRLTQPGGGSHAGYYMEWINGGTGLSVYATSTLRGRDTTKTYTAGDQITFRAVGTTLTVYKNGAVQLQLTASDFNAAGNIELGCRSNAVRMVNFGGGTL